MTSCANCLYYTPKEVTDPDDTFDGYCMRYPPCCGLSANPSRNSMCASLVMPKTYADFFCGEWHGIVSAGD